MKNLLLTALAIAGTTVFAQTSTTICPNSMAMLTAPNPQNLSAPSYSLNPGGITSGNNFFTVLPTNSVVTYTLYTTGTNTNSVVVTTSVTSTVFVVNASFSVSSPQNFTLGCGTKSVVQIQVVPFNVFPQGTSFSYSLLPLGSSTAVSAGPLLPGPLNTSTPGTYTLLVRNSFAATCDFFLPLSVIVNTFQPQLSVSVPKQVVDCITPSVTLFASSSNNNPSFVWAFQGVPGISASSSIVVVANSAAPAATLINTFTMTVTDQDNLCKTNTVVPIYQNIFPPKPKIAGNICAFNNNILTNQSISGIPQNFLFPIILPVVGFWYPPNGGTPTLSNTYLGNSVGVYTMVATDLNNGCTAAATVFVNLCEGVEEQSKFGVIIYPNPAQEFLFFEKRENQEIDVTIYDLNGRMVISESTEEGRMNIDGLTHGVYYLVARKSDGEEFRMKIVKE
jgi:hypothetical protein